MDQRRLTLKEFAEQVNYSDRQITRYIAKGKLLPRRNLSGRYYFLQKDVDKFNTFNAVDKAAILDLTASENINECE